MIKNLYNYDDDINTFFKELSSPPGRDNVPFTMNQVGSSLIVGKTIGQAFIPDYYVEDMEGNYNETSSFSEEQLNLLRKFNADGKHYQFLGYPDIPASVMRVMALYADQFPEPSSRIQLWKLGRSGIRNPYIMDICCCALVEGLNLADCMVIDNANDYLLNLHKEQAEELGVNNESIILPIYLSNFRQNAPTSISGDECLSFLKVKLLSMHYNAIGH